MNRRFLRVLHKSPLRMLAFSFFSPIILPTWRIEICNFLPRQKNAGGYVMKFTPKHFLYVILSPPHTHISSSSDSVTEIKYSQCFQMIVGKKLSDPLYMGGNYIDNCRFPWILSCTRPKDRRNRSSIFSNPTFLTRQDCKTNSIDNHYHLLYQPPPSAPHEVVQTWLVL